MCWLSDGDFLDLAMALCNSTIEQVLADRLVPGLLLALLLVLVSVDLRSFSDTDDSNKRLKSDGDLEDPFLKGLPADLLLFTPLVKGLPVNLLLLTPLVFSFFLLRRGASWGGSLSASGVGLFW